MAKINGNEAPEAITKIQLLTKTSSDQTTPLANIQLEQGEPLFIDNAGSYDLNNPRLYIGDNDGSKVGFYSKSQVDSKIAALDSNSSEAPSGSFLTYVELVDGKISSSKTANNAATASKWKTPRKIELTGDVTGVVESVDGSGDISISTTVVDDLHNHVISNVDGLSNELSGKAPTYHASTNTTYGTSTASHYGHAMASNTSPKMNGTATVGSETAKFARGDHIHPTDTSRAPSNHTHTTIQNDLELKKGGNYFKMTAGSFNAKSDMRLKENFQPLKPEKSILDLPTYKFDFINGAKNQIGCKAQDLQEICPEIVNEDADGMLSIQESKIVYLLLEEVKKLRKEVEDLKRG